MRLVRRLEKNMLFMATLAVFGIVSTPIAPPLALAVGTTATNTQASHYLDNGCGGAKQVADDRSDFNSATLPVASIPPPLPQISPSPSATSSATPIPLYAPASGPGKFVLPAATPASFVTIPPVPTPTPTISAAVQPIVLTRASAAPTTAASPAASASLSPGASPAASPATSPAISPTASPENTPVAMPSAIPTLGPNQIAILADEVNGSTKAGIPADASGNVHVFYSEGVLIGDTAHYDGDRYITVTGHTHLINNTQDSRLDADSIIFDIRENRAVLANGKGATTRGVERGKIYYTSQHLRANSNGVVHGTAATFSTCENPRGGYHMYARTIDVTPGEKMVARHVLVFLGGVAILFIPVLVVPLNRQEGQRHPVVFAPEVGYNQAQGAYVRVRLGFGSKDTYYGYYRIEEYSKAGLGLGYVAYIGRRDNRRQVNINAYTLQGKNGSGRQDNLSIQDTENFSQHTRGQFGVTYTGDYGPYVNLPASYSLSGTLTHATQESSESYTFSRYAVGSQQSTLNGAFQITRQLSGNVTQGLQLSYTDNVNSYSGVTIPTSSLHINALTHATSRFADYDFTIDQTDSASPSGYNKVPELVIHPHSGRGTIPFDTQLTIGQYTEPSDSRETTRGEFDANIGPALFKVFHSSDLSITFGASQYAYGTGDLKAQTRQNVNLTTPISKHFNNVISYTEQNTAGPPAEPFQYLDVLGGAAHNAQEVLRIFNGDIYTLSLSTSTGFNHQAQPIAYQLTSHPSLRSTVIVAGSYVPGPGNGFPQTNVQIATPIGRGQDIEFTTNVNWKLGERFMNKNIYFRKLIGDCYDVRASYNEDLKAVNVSLDLLSFPSRSANFGFSTEHQAIFPQNFIAP